MPKVRSASKRTFAARRTASTPDADTVVQWLRSHGSRTVREGMARFNIPSDRAFGISMGALTKYAKELGRDHELADALWKKGWYEARMLALHVDEPERVTPAQMDRWARDFDNWAIVDTACFALFDRTPHAWKKVEAWAPRREEFIRRAAFALIWSLSVHDRESGDEPFLRSLRLIERYASDERHFVSKAISMALRAIGKRNIALNEAAVTTAQRLADSDSAPACSVGKEALRELTSASVKNRLSRVRQRR